VQGELSALRTYLGSIEAGVAPPPKQPPRYPKLLSLNLKLCLDPNLKIQGT